NVNYANQYDRRKSVAIDAKDDQLALAYFELNGNENALKYYEKYIKVQKKLFADAKIDSQLCQ
ncbi:unnamed protein product, partial [Didymodactylos carnosus]